MTARCEAQRAFHAKVAQMVREGRVDVARYLARVGATRGADRIDWAIAVVEAKERLA